MCGYYSIEFINYMIKGKALLDYTNLFSPNDFKKNDQIIKRNNLELVDINKYRLNEIHKIKDYFNNEINDRKNIIKKLSKYKVTLDYLDKIFITLSASFGTLSVTAHATVLGIPLGIAGASLTLLFTISAGINKSLLQLTKKRKKNIIK